MDIEKVLEKPKTDAQLAYDALPFWMRQMMRDKVKKCLAADANELKRLHQHKK